MSDLPPDLPRLETLATYLQLQLSEVHDRIRQLTADPGYRLEPVKPPAHTAVLHRASCKLGRGHHITRSEALTAIGDDGLRSVLELCRTCRPDDTLP